MNHINLENARVLKLATGESVIGIWEAFGDDAKNKGNVERFAILRDPYQIERSEFVSSDGDTTKYEIQCFEWMPFIKDNSLLIQKNTIIAIAMPDDVLLGCYSGLLQMSYMRHPRNEEAN